MFVVVMVDARMKSERSSKKIAAKSLHRAARGAAQGISQHHPPIQNQRDDRPKYV
jgi:hypothetical protein